MATSQYYAWDRAGRPLNPAQPIREFVGKLKVAFPKAAAAAQFSWYADNAHYQANYPEDHTPYSYSGWPIVNPYPYVFATDVMHRPDLGVDCSALFAYWIGEARAGRMPWLKYLIWQARVYSVRNGWQPVLNSGHHDHIHLSARTDHLNTSLGGWSVVPGAAPPPTRRRDGMYFFNVGQSQYVADPAFERYWAFDNYPRWQAVHAAAGSPPVVPVSAANLAAGVFGQSQGIYTIPRAPSPAVEVELSDEDLARIADAAREGAEAGAPSAEEIADAVADEQAERLTS